jgi:hypothetical protein
MASVGETSFENDAALVDKVLTEVTRPAEVLDVTYEEGEDWTGDPVIWIWVVVPRDVNPSHDRIRRLSDYAEKLHWKLLDSGVKRWPFVRFHEFIQSKDRVRRNGARR